MKWKFNLLTLLLCLISTAVYAGPPASAVNVIKSVDLSEEKDGTRIVIDGTEKATYSVFKLNKPPRLFVDISNSRPDSGLSRVPIDVDNGVISQIAVLEFSDDVQQITRLIIGFDKVATYDVEVEGDRIVVLIDGAGRAQGAAANHRKEIEKRDVALDRAKRALVQKERHLTEIEGRVEVLQRALTAAKKDEGRRVLEQALERERRVAKQLRKDMEERSDSVESLKKTAENERRRARELQERLGDAQARAQELQSVVASLKKEQGLLAKDRDDARRRARTLAKERDIARKDSKALSKKSDIVRSRLSRIEKDLSAAEEKLVKAESSRRGALADAEKLRVEITGLRGRLASQDREASQLRGQVGALEKARTNARTNLSNGVEGAVARLKSIEDDYKAKTDELKALDRRLDLVTNELGRKEQALDASIARARNIEADKDKVRSETERVKAEQVREKRNALEAEKARLAAFEKVKAADEARLAELARARSKEEQRLQSLAEARKIEESRLAAIKEKVAAATVESSADVRNVVDRLKVEEARLMKLKVEVAKLEKTHRATNARNAEEMSKVKKERRAEETRLANLRKEIAAEEKSLKKEVAAANRKVKSIDSRLTVVEEKGDKATLTLKQSASGAVVETSNIVRAVRFQQKGKISRIIIDLDRPGNFETVPWSDGKASLMLKRVKLPTKLERTLDTQAFGGTVQYVSSYREGDGSVRVDAHVPSATTEIVRQDGSSLIWEFSSIGAGAGVGSPEHAAAKARKPVAAPARPSGFTSAPPSIGGRSTRNVVNNASPPWQRRPRSISRKRITIDLRGADVQNVLRLIAREGNVNIVAGDTVQGTVTMKLDNVLLSDAFVTILKSLNLGYEQDGEVIRVAPSESFESAAKKRRDSLIASFPLEPLEVVLMPLSYAKASEVQKLVGTVLSQRGSVEVDKRTNTLVIKDVAQNLSAAQQLILGLDAQTPQVLIEARIVETNDQFTRQFGIQWGGDFLSAPANSNATGLVFPSVVGVAGAATDGQTPLAGIIGAPNFAVNMPAAIGTGSGGGLGVTLGSIGGAGNLALRLSALEREGHIKIVSAPRILTLDNTSASISTGTQIPVAVVSAAGAQTTFVEANLSLDVTPHVTQDGNIQMVLNISKSEPDFANTGAAGDPSIITRDASTELLVGDGDTTVIGGIFAHTTATGSNKVPFLADIPILGFFFRDYSEDENRNELLIFVTPRIVNREAALDSRRLNPIDSPDIGGAE